MAIIIAAIMRNTIRDMGMAIESREKESIITEAKDGEGLCGNILRSTYFMRLLPHYL